MGGSSCWPSLVYAMPPHTSTAISASQLTSRCSTQNWARPPDSTLFSIDFDMGTSSFRRLLRRQAAGCDFDRRAVIEETRPLGHHPLAWSKTFGNENGTV